MNPNVNMPNMNPMGGPVGGAPVNMMNNGAMGQQGPAGPPGARQQQMLDNQRGVLNTYIYEYFIRYGMYDCARSLLSSEQQVNVHKDGTKGGNAVNGSGDDSMDGDSKEDLDTKLPDDLPPPKLPMPASDQSFLYEWFCLFWDIYNAQRAKSGNPQVNQYVNHTQQELLRQMRPDMAQQQYHQMMRMQSGMGPLGMKQQPGNLARTAMVNNQNNPQMQMLQQAKQNQMQRDPSAMEGNRDRPASPASGENAPSPSKRQRIDTAPFNPNQPGAMMPNGRPMQGMPPQQMPGGPNAAAAQQMLANGLTPGQLQQHFQNFQHHGSQMGNKQMPNAGGPQGQGSPLMQGPDGSTLNNYYNPPGGEMGAGPNGMRAGPNGAQAAGGGSNHALQDYQMQLMLLEQQNKKRLMMARQEQDNIGGMPREGQPPGPGGPVPTGPNGQPFPEASPQAMRSGTSPNPAEQMKRGTPQMNNSSIPSPVPEGGQQSRGSPNSGMNFMGGADPKMAPHFFPGADGSMAGAPAQMNGMRPPSSHPGQPFNGQMNPQMMRQQQQAQGQNPQQWQGPNGQMVPQGMQQNQQMQGTPQQRAMPPPSAPANAAANNANNRTTASPQQAAAAPPTPNQTSKPAPKKKETKGGKKAAANKKNQNAAAANNNNNSNNANASATPAAENNNESENPPQTPITPVNAGGFKNGQNANQPATTSAAAAAAAAPAAAAAAPQAPVGPPQGQPDPSQNGLNMGDFTMNFMEIDNPLATGDVLNDFDFDSFLHDGDGNGEAFDFHGAFSNMDGGEIGTE